MWLKIVGFALLPILLLLGWIILRLAVRAALYWIRYPRYMHIPKLSKSFSVFDMMSLTGGLSQWLNYTYDPKTGEVPPVSDHGFSMTLDGSHYLMFNTPEAAKQILTDSQLFPKLPMTYNLIKPFLGEGLVTSEGKIWKDHRRLLTPLFFFNNLKNTVPILNQFISNNLDQIHNQIKKSPNGVHELDTETYFKHLTMSVIIAIAFGGDFDIDWMADKWHEMTNAMNLQFVMEMLLGSVSRYLSFLGTGRLWKTRDEVIKTIKKTIAHRREHPKENEKIVDLLTAMMQLKDDEATLSDQDMVDQCLTFLFAGHDTTASTLCWVIYFLARHPAEMQRARDEVDRILGPRTSQDEHVMISADKIHELECCKAIFNETLRLRSVVLAVDRYPVRDTVIDGVMVPGGQGSALGIGFYNIHRNPLYWPQPEQFIPARFISGSAHHDPKRHPFAFIPFSAGERNCIGQKLAQNEALLCIAHVVRRFDFSVNELNMIHTSAPLYVPKNLIWQVRERKIDAQSL